MLANSCSFTYAARATAQTARGPKFVDRVRHDSRVSGVQTRPVNRKERTGYKAAAQSAESSAAGNVGETIPVAANRADSELKRGNSQQMGAGKEGRLLSLVPGPGTNGELASPFQGAPWREVLEHVGNRLNWTDERIISRTIEVPAEPTNEALEAIANGLQWCDVAVGVGLQQGWGAEWLSARLHDNAKDAPLASLDEGLSDVTMPRTVVFLDCHSSLESICCLGGLFLDEGEIPAWRKGVAAWGLPGDHLASALQVTNLVHELWYRHSSEDLLYALLVLLNEYVMEIPLVSGQLKEKTDATALLCMMGNCRQEVLDCVRDPECKAGLDCLETCALNDQVCSYRCIVSHESPLLEAFSLCILQKRNCLRNKADIPMRPHVGAMTQFRGEALTWEVAEQLFIGWLGNQPCSWRVVAGVNPAYDYFPCQYQLFYPGKARGSMWYEPVFKVTKYNGEQVWRRRKYRMRRAKEYGPGHYHLSVLDNGVISSEFWRIVDVADDLSWGIFYYSGAASVVGQTYQGAVFVTPDGLWPSEHHLPRISASLDSAGIKMWELYNVDQGCCNTKEAPLDITDMRPFDPLV